MLQLVPQNKQVPFEDFYQDNYKKVVLYIRKKISNLDDAEDLASEIFEYCYTHYDNYDPEKASLTTWLYIIVNSRIKNHYRDSREHVDLDSLSNVLPDDNSDMDNAIYLEQVSDQLRKAITKLPPRHQELIRLSYFEKRTSIEIGQIMDMSPVNVRVQLSRALKKLEDLCKDLL